MKVILLQDVAKIGKRSSVVEVPDGYALNQLIPKRMAEPATAGNVKRLEQQQAKNQAADAAGANKFAEVAAKLATQVVTVKAEANELGHLFKAVNEQDIAEAADQVSVGINPAMVLIGSPIKEVGEHQVSLVRGEEKVTFTIAVEKK